MKQLLFLLLFPSLALAQYQGNANQKITLGEQTTADGLVFRGVLNDTALITPLSDTSAYIILDTVNNKFYNYNRTTNVWSVAGGGTAVTSITGGTGLTGGTITSTGTLAADTNFLVTRFDTSSMLTNYYRAGRNTIIQAADVPTLNQNTTGSAATLTTGRTIQTNLASTSAATFNGSANITPGVTGTLPVANGGTNVSTLTSSGVLYASSGSQVATSSNLTFNGSTALTIQNIRIWKGKANQDASMAIGYQALDSTTTGDQNMAVGYQSQLTNTTGSYNNSYGFQTLYFNKTGSYNNAFGYRSLFVTTGERNSGLGVQSLLSNTTGSYNTAIGFEAGYDNTTGNDNVFIGNRAAGQTSNANTTGNNNIIIGSTATGASATASNVITLGNSSIATIRAQVTTITSLSDIRDKTDIIPLNYGINFIDKLKPVSFVWDMRDGGKIGIPEIGFIAQDLQKAQIDLGINIPNLVSGTDEKLEASYGVLLPIIVKALQEANEKIKSLEQRIINLENK